MMYSISYYTIIRLYISRIASHFIDSFYEGKGSFGKIRICLFVFFLSFFDILFL
jgi:hypothetical protein